MECDHAYEFRDILEKYPDRVLNIGIFEDGMISVAAGLALGGIEPTIYGISPFIVDRALEQLKLDFAYQNLGGNFITTGAAYDFSTLGYSHYCPEDIGVLYNLPGFEFIAPGTGEEFSILYKSCVSNGNPTYYRLSDYDNKNSQNVTFGKANVIKKGDRAIVIAVGTMLDAVIEAVNDLDVTILYYTTLLPFDTDSIKKFNKTGEIIVCEPEYIGSLDSMIISSLEGEFLRLSHVGIPRKILRNYGSKEEKDFYCKLTAKDIRNTVMHILTKE